MPADSIRIHHFEPISRVNGPGARAVVWVQGCTLACPGCYNPNTHARNAGKVVPVATIINQVRSIQASIQGITISGGEPLQQLSPLMSLLSALRTETQLSSLVFTGFSWQEIQNFPQAGQLLSLMDVLIAGRYQQDQRQASGLLGSRNKTVHFLSDRYTMRDLLAVPEAEVLIQPDGSLSITGIDPLAWVQS